MNKLVYWPFLSAVTLSFCLSAPVCVIRADDAMNLSTEAVLQRLVEGNARYAGGKMRHPNQSRKRRVEQAKSQHPFAVVVACSDSRVPPELVFDRGIGDLFVVRTAGHRLDNLALASIEYAVEHLNCPVVIVLGHERCGAVSAALEASGTGPGDFQEPDAHGGHLVHLVHALQDAVSQAKNLPGDPVENAVRENIRIVTTGLAKQSPVLAARIKSGKLRTAGFRYDLDSGQVTPVNLEDRKEP